MVDARDKRSKRRVLGGGRAVPIQVSGGLGEIEQENNRVAMIVPAAQDGSGAALPFLFTIDK
jgi:hypothetical protein